MNGETRAGCIEYFASTKKPRNQDTRPRYQTFITSDLASGGAFKACWGHMRAEVSTDAREATAFGVDAKDAPGQPSPEGVDPRASPGKVRLQRLCARARQAVRKRAIQLRMEGLGSADALRRARDVDISSAFFVGLPTAHTRASGQEVCSMVTIYMGIEDPLLLHHKGVVFRDRNTRGGPLFRELDAHGHALSLYFGAGHGRFALHNELEALSHRFALLVGLKAFRQPADVFTSAIRKSRGTGSMVTCARRRRRTGAESSLTSLSGGSTFLAGKLAS